MHMQGVRKMTAFGRKTPAWCAGLQAEDEWKQEKRRIRSATVVVLRIRLSGVMTIGLG